MQAPGVPICPGLEMTGRVAPPPTHRPKDMGRGRVTQWVFRWGLRS